MSFQKSPWQSSSRTRGFRLLSYSVPTLILASLASSLLPPALPEEILKRGWGESVLIRGRLELPERKPSEVQTAWVIEGPMPKPKAGVLNIRAKTLDNSFDVKKRWNFAPHMASGGGWASIFYLKLPPGELLAYRIRSEGAPEIPATATLRVVTDPARGIDKYLRMIAILVYPSLTMAFIGLALVLFSKSPGR